VTDALLASVIVPAHNAAGTLSDVLAALKSQTIAGDRFEVVVVDDASSDDTANIGRAAGARVISAPRHIGVAASRNLGARSAHADVLAFLDADCVPAATWVEHGVGALDALDADILAGEIEVAVDNASPVALVSLTHDFDQELYASQGFGATGNLWVRRHVFDRAGAFDEKLERNEDREFGLSAVAAGATLRYAPDVVVTHPSRGFNELARRSFRIGTDRGLGSFRDRARAGAYVTGDRVRTRLERAGFAPTRQRLLAMGLAKNVALRAPMALGVLVGSVRRTRRAEPPGGSYGRDPR
jgi:glycosyltransferase involved in cell wall biosynthesis